MYKKDGINFRVEQEVEESLLYQEPEIYEKLQKYKVKDDCLWLGYDDVMKTFNSDWCYGCALKDKKNNLNKILKQYRIKNQGIYYDDEYCCDFTEHNVVALLNHLLNENEKLKQSEKDCQELNHKLINENDELEQEIRKFKRIIDILEVERCEYLTDKQARSKWGDNYD